MKATARYNLPINENYTIIDSFYTGGLENGCPCDNCGKLLANVATIKNSAGVTFNVGLDCAETLSNVNGLFEVKAWFAEAKALRAKINKLVKTEPATTYEVHYFGVIMVGYIRIPTEFAKQYMKDILTKVINPDKLDFAPLAFDRLLPFDKYLRPVNMYNDGLTFDVSQHGYKITISGVQSISDNGHVNHLYNVCVDGIGEKMTYNHNDIVWSAQCLINKHNFNKC